MNLTRDRDAERARIADSLQSAWTELDEVRTRWIENPLDPVLGDELEETERRVAELEERYSRVVRKRYGSWYGIDE